MNVHVSNEIKERFRCLDFRGKPVKKANGKTYIQALHRTLGTTCYYCFEEDFAWFTNGDKPWDY